MLPLYCYFTYIFFIYIFFCRRGVFNGVTAQTDGNDASSETSTDHVIVYSRELYIESHVASFHGDYVTAHGTNVHQLHSNSFLSRLTL